MTIDMLPDDVLVEIFKFYVSIRYWPNSTPRNTWHTLVHVCRRWRHVVFASPRHLNIRLEYDGDRSMSEVLDTWPAVLPVMLLSNPGLRRLQTWQWELWLNLAIALESEHHNRICRIQILNIANSRWERFAVAMQKSFSRLTHLDISVVDGDVV